MKKHPVLSSVLYWISIIIPVICVGVMAGSVVLLPRFGFERKNLIIVAAIWLVSLILIKVFTEIRIKARMNVEYDEFGNSKKNGKFERMSAKERAAIDKQKVMDMERLVGSNALKRMSKEGSKNPEKDMQSMIGMDEVKNEMMRFVARIEYDKRNKNKDRLSSLHMCFTGSPGTGKTTVARIMAGFLYKSGAIKKNMVIETDGNFLKGRTAEQTAQKTTMVCRQAFGGVLFIDEAYALMYGDVTGAAAIATLIKLMEDERSRFVVILAGYGNEMREMIRSNPGFESRITTYFDFPDYTEDELIQIMSVMMKPMNMSFESEAVTKKLKKRFSNEKRLKAFANGRTARNVLSECIDNHAVNMKMGVLKKNMEKIICEEDVSETVKKSDLWK